MLKALSFRGRSSPRAAAPALVLAAVSVYLIIAPAWSPKILWWTYDNARILQLCLLSAIGALAAAPSLSGLLADSWSRLNRPAASLLVVLCGGGALSAALSAAPHVGAHQLALVILLIGLTLTLASIVRHGGPEAQAVLSIAVLSGVVLVVLQFWAAQIVTLVQPEPPFNWHSPFLEFANVRFFSQYQSYVLLLIVLPISLFKLGRSSRLLLYVVAANAWGLQWMVGTRAVWVAFAVTCLVILLFGGAHRRRWLTQQAIGVAAGFAIFLIVTELVLPATEAPPIPKTNSVVDRGWRSVNERVVMMKSSAELTLRHPLLGVGPGQFGLHYAKTMAAHPHNSVLQLLAEYGLIAGGAGVALLIMLGLYALSVIRAGPQGDSGAVSVYVAAALMMGLLESCFSGNLTMPHSQILFCVTAGWMLGRSITFEGENQLLQGPHGGQRSMRFALSGVVVLAAGIVAILGFEYVDAVRGMPWWLNPNPPNLWQYGRFSDW